MTLRISNSMPSATRPPGECLESLEVITETPSVICLGRRGLHSGEFESAYLHVYTVAARASRPCGSLRSSITPGPIGTTA